MASDIQRSREITGAVFALQKRTEDVMKKNAAKALDHVALCQVRAWEREVLSEEHVKVMDAFMSRFGMTPYLVQTLPSPAYALRMTSLSDDGGEYITEAVTLIPDLLAPPRGNAGGDPVIVLEAEAAKNKKDKIFKGYKGVRLLRSKVKEVVTALLSGPAGAESPAVDPEEFACAFILQKKLHAALNSPEAAEGNYIIPENGYDGKYLELREAVREHYGQQRLDAVVYAHCARYMDDGSLPVKGQGGVTETLLPKLSPFTAPPVLKADGLALPFADACGRGRNSGMTAPENSR